MKLSVQLAAVGVMTLAALSAGCTTETTTVTPVLCSPTLVSVESPTGAALTSSGGTARLVGRFFWTPAGSGTDPTPLCGAEADPAGAYNRLYNLEVLVGAQRATVTAAWERNVSPPVYFTTALEAEPTASTCATCASCVAANTTGCGSCESACAGCEQVIDVTLPPLTSDDGTRTAETSRIAVPIMVVGPIGQTAGMDSTPGFYMEASVTCADSVDNDSDGLIDDEDPDCVLSSGLSETDCGDGIDNDADGQIDQADPGCTAPEAPRELEACANGIDDDGDGDIDEEDPACGSDASLSEAFVCENGLDDDRDGLIDEEDPGCDGDPEGETEISACEDGVDNDGDNQIDCEDPECETTGGSSE